MFLLSGTLTESDSYKSGKMYSTCIQCFNKQVRCEFRNKELNRSYLRSQVKNQHIKYNHDNKHAQLRTTNNTGGDLLPAQIPAEPPGQLPTKLNNDDNTNDYNDDNNDDNDKCKRTLIVGPSFCGKSHLLLNKLQLIRLSDSEKQIKITTRSPGQYQNMHSFAQLGDTEGALHVSVEEDLEDRTQDFKKLLCCI